MKKNKQNLAKENKRTHRGRVWLWGFIVVLIVAGATAWVLQDGGIVNWRDVVSKIIPSDSAEQVVETPVVSEVVDEQVSAQGGMVETAQVAETMEMQPACAVVEKLLLKDIAPDDSTDYLWQESSAQVYKALAKYGCSENSTFFTDMSARKQAIADGLKAGYGYENNSMTSVEYLYSDEKICQTIENRVMKNINPNAYTYEEFLSNAKTYSVLYEYGCCDNKASYMKAAVRELGVAVALMPTDKMTRDEIITVVEICKSLGVADAAHLMVQRLKARGYDRAFLLEMENIIHGIR